MKNPRRVVVVGCSVLAAAAFSTGAQGEDVPPKLVSASVGEAPSLDGVSSDEAWQAAVDLEVTAKRPLPPDKGASVSVYRLGGGFTVGKRPLLLEMNVGHAVSLE